LIALIAAVAMIGSSLLLKLGPQQMPVRVIFALIPLPFFAYLTVSLIQSGRALDEFQLRIQMEAVLGGFLSTALLLLSAGLLQWAGAIGPINLAFVWPLMAVLYTISYSIAGRRYRVQ
jgi:hypothetical protein